MRTAELLGVSAAIALADTIIKASIKEPLITKNRGFAHNRLDDHQHVVAAVSALLTAVVAKDILSGKKRSLWLALILGGALSNTYERVFKGYVTDYIKIGNTVYNISDFAIFAGALMHTIQSLTSEKEELKWEK
ncbi:MAG: signal peptidase II [Lachnospiraceae bacterium]|nr:signal peptidase II [Lachnospiraceae bacterium]